VLNDIIICIFYLLSEIYVTSKERSVLLSLSFVDQRSTSTASCSRLESEKKQIEWQNGFLVVCKFVSEGIEWIFSRYFFAAACEQARNQLGTPEGAKSFLRRANVF